MGAFKAHCKGEHRAGYEQLYGRAMRYSFLRVVFVDGLLRRT